MNTRRIFTSIDLPQEVKEAIKAIHNTKIYPIKWMEVSNLHITLNFLGDLKEKQIEDAVSIVEKISALHSSFDLSLNRLLSKRHMLWLLPMKSQALLDVKNDLDQALREERIGKRERQRYSPHILIAKMKNDKRKMKFKTENFKPIEFRVDSISIYQSELTPGSATHTLIERFDLA